MFNPFDQQPMLLGDAIMDWEELYPKPYSKQTVDPYTKTRVILMNGIEVESTLFLHQFHRNCTNNELRRFSAPLGTEQQNGSTGCPSLMRPANNHRLNTWQWISPPGSRMNRILMEANPDCFAEDFDHLYRYANLPILTKHPCPQPGAELR